MPSLLPRIQDWLLQQGIAAEIQKAGLARKSIPLSCGQLSYLISSAPPHPDRIPVLMLHGAVADSTTWVRFARLLQGGHPLLIPDLPGHGESCADPALSYTIAAQAQRVVDMLGALGIARAHVMGSSMGGAIAMRLAARHPALVASLVLIGTVGVEARESWLQQHIRETGRNPMVAIRTRQDYKDMIAIGMQHPPYMPGFVIASLARRYMERLPVNTRVAEDIMTDLDQRAELAQIRCPALLVWGREDRVSHVANAQELQRQLLASEVRILDNVGHVPMVEAPAALAEACKAFLR